MTVSMNYFKEKENKSDSTHMVQLMNIVFSSQKTYLSQVPLHNLFLLFLYIPASSNVKYMFEHQVVNLHEFTVDKKLQCIASE